jgi:hypothetical protein
MAARTSHRDKQAGRHRQEGEQISIDAKSAARSVSTVAPARLARVRRGSLAVLVLVVAEYLYLLLPPSGRRG